MPRFTMPGLQSWPFHDRAMAHFSQCPGRTEVREHFAGTGRFCAGRKWQCGFVRGERLGLAGGDESCGRLGCGHGAGDGARRTGIKSDAAAGDEVVLIGTIGKSPLIDSLIKRHKLDISGIRANGNLP